MSSDSPNMPQDTERDYLIPSLNVPVVPEIPGSSNVSGLPGVDDDDGRSCWVCFATEFDDNAATWVQPCNCKGATKWVHQNCLQRWLDEKQRGDMSRKVLCPQCKTEYTVVFSPLSRLVMFLDHIERTIHRMCPFIAGTIFVGTVYWTAVTYGGVTVMQVVGQKEGLDMMEAADPSILLILLPSIPVALVSAKLLNWEDCVLRFLRRQCTRMPLLGYVLPFGQVPENQQVPQRLPSNGSQMSSHNLVISVSSHSSPMRVFCSALLLPSISTIVGKIFFSYIKNNLHRTLVGGLSYIVVRGAMRIYHKQMMYVRLCSRKVLDFQDASVSREERRV